MTLIRRVEHVWTGLLLYGGATAAVVGYGVGAAGLTSLGDGLRIGGWWAFGLGVFFAALIGGSEPSKK